MSCEKKASRISTSTPSIPARHCYRICSSTETASKGDNQMRYLHAMVPVPDSDAPLQFFRGRLGLGETRRRDYPDSRFTRVYLGAPQNPEAEVELTFNYDDEDYGSARNFGHLAFEVDDIHA